MTLTAMLAELYRRTGYATSPASEITTRFTAFLNLAQRKLLTKPGFGRLRDDTTTFASAVSTSVYALPPSVAKIQSIQDRTNNRRLEEKSLTWLRGVDPGLTSTGGQPTVYIPLGYQQVAVQPSNASEIFIKSTSASDTNNAYLEGFRTGGYPIVIGPIAMTGVTAKTFSAAITDIVEITKVYLSAAAVGTVTVHEDSGVGTELARIPIGQLYARYQAIQLWPVPGAITTYHVDYVRTIPDMVNATDEPLLPEDFHYLLVEGALLKEWTKKDDLTRRNIAQADYDDGLRDLRRWLIVNPDTTASLRAVPVRFSQLGPSYPSGS